MIVFLLAFFMVSCTLPVIEKPVDPPAPVGRSIDELLKLDTKLFPETPYWDKEYDEIALATLKEFPVKKLPCDPLVTLVGIAKAESGLKKNSTYMEPAPLNYSSDGLFQLSIQDESWAKCGFKTKADVRHPLRNIYCAIKIMSSYEKKWPERNFYEAQGAYWSVLRWNKFPKWAGKKQDGWLRVKKYWESQGCKL